MNCNCQELPALVNLKEYPQFLDNKKTLASHEWKTEQECIVCGQKWIVDTWDKYQETYAVRGDNTAEVESMTKQLILEKIIERRGGLEEQNCVWENCLNKRVKGMAMCAKHLYKSGHRG